MSILDLIPPRVAFTDASGKLTREGFLFLQGVFTRIGGSDADTITAITILIEALQAADRDHDTLLAFAESGTAAIAELQKQVEELRQQVTFMSAPTPKPEDIYVSVFD